MRRSTITRRFALTSLALAALASAARADTSFFRSLLDKPRATAADAFRVMVILRTRSLQPATFQQDVQTLRKAGILPAKWRWAADKPVTCGEVSYLLCKTLGIKGGLTMRIFGPSRRYAFRECEFLKLVPEGHQGKYLTGEELVAIAGLAEQYLRDRETPAF